MKTLLSPTLMRKGKHLYNLFQGISSIALPLVNGSILTLYAMKIGASSFTIGLISAFNYLAFMMVPLGKYFIPYFGSAKVMALGMFIRYFFIVPIILIPIFLNLNLTKLAHFSIIIGSLLFNVFRGIALVGQNPIIDQICSDSKDRSKYLAINVTIVFLFTIIGNLLLGLSLKILNNSHTSYIILFTLGTATGLISSLFLFKIPFSKQENVKIKIISVFKNAWQKKSFKHFFICHFGISFVSALIRPFIIVYSKSYFNISDSTAIFVSTAGAVGSFFMGIFTRAIFNFVGSKTLYVLFMVVACVSLLPIIISPNLTGEKALIFLFVVNFFVAFSLQGTESNAQNYFFTIANKNELVELSVIFFVIFGLAGSLGSTLGGYLLDVFTVFFHNNIHTTFRFYFLFSLLLSIYMLYKLHSLHNTGRYSVLRSFGFMLNIRDLKAIGLANKLESNIENTDEHRNILKKIGTTDSAAPADLLIDSLASPRHLVRYETLITIANIKNLKDKRLIEALINYIKDPNATSRFMAINILGQNKISDVLPLVQKTICSNDYMLKAESIRALGHLRNYASVKLIEAELNQDNHLYVLTQSISALERIYKKEDATKLFKILSWKNFNHYGLIGEILLAISRVLHFEGFFYRYYTIYLHDKEQAYAELSDPYISKIKLFGTNFYLENLLNATNQKDYVINMKKFIEETPLLSNFKNQSITDDFNRLALNPVMFRFNHVRFFFIVVAVLSHTKMQGGTKH